MIKKLSCLAMLMSIALLSCTTGTFASTATTTVFESFGPFIVDDTGGPINSGGPVGDPSNSVITTTSVGGYVADTVIVSGTLDNSTGIPGTWGSEADLDISTFAGGAFVAQGGIGTTYTPPLAVPGTTTSVAPFDPGAGPMAIEFFESFDDGAGPDQTWLDVKVDFVGTTITNGEFGIGALPDDGTMVFGPGQTPNLYHSNVAGGLDFFDFSVGPVGPGGYLNIQSFDADTGDTIDTEIGLFDASGVLVAFDDDGQETALGGLYSMLSFGIDDPLAPGGFDANAGDDGLTLASGAYTLVLGGFDTNFEDLTIGTSTIGEVIPGTSSGDYGVKFTYSIPEPSSIVMLLLAVFGAASLRNR